MSNVRAIKARIKSVSNTRKVTKAMQLISAAKLKKVQSLAESASIYSDVLSQISRAIDFSEIEAGKYFTSPKSEDVKNITIIVVGPAQAFAGALSTNLTAVINSSVSELAQKYPGAEFSGISIQKNGIKILNHTSLKPIFHFDESLEKPDTTALFPIYKTILDGYNADGKDEKNGKDAQVAKTDLVYIAYTHFVNTIQNVPIFRQLLPISMDEISAETAGKDVDKKQKTKETFRFEPDVNSIAKFLFNEYFENQILSAILDSSAAENASRMLSMKNATDNANSIIDSLVQNYNSQRQANITQELLEVSSSAF